jgi:hypothetical protein
MTEAKNETLADRDRRRLLLGTGGAALALAATPAAAGDPRPTTPTYAISRTRYSTAASAYLPTTGDTYVMPLAQVVATDNNTDSTLNADNTIRINNAGNYRVILAVDWSAGKGRDCALRTAGLRRRPAGSQAIVVAPGGALTKITDSDEQLATEDLPGSATPKTVRLPAPPNGAHDVFTPFPWTPGTIPVGGYASVDITMPIANIVAPGDVALASLTSITDATIGAAAVSALVVTAKAIAQDTVRVTVFNPSISPSVTIPQGDLQVLGMSTQQITGGSSEARTVMSTTTLTLAAGDTIYAILSSLAPGDMLQSSAEVYVEVEKFTQTS